MNQRDIREGEILFTPLSSLTGFRNSVTVRGDSQDKGTQVLLVFPAHGDLHMRMKSKEMTKADAYIHFRQNKKSMKK